MSLMENYGFSLDEDGIHDLEAGIVVEANKPFHLELWRSIINNYLIDFQSKMENASIVGDFYLAYELIAEVPYPNPTISLEETLRGFADSPFLDEIARRIATEPAFEIYEILNKSDDPKKIVKYSHVARTLGRKEEVNLANRAYQLFQDKYDPVTAHDKCAQYFGPVLGLAYVLAPDIMNPQ